MYCVYLLKNNFKYLPEPFREEAVHVLGFEVSEEELKDGLKGSHIQR